MTLCLWDLQSPASCSLGSLGGMPTVHVPLWRSLMSCVRIKRKLMGNVLLQHEGMPARLLYSKLLEVRFHLFGDPPRINSTVRLLFSALRQSIARNRSILIHLGCSDPGSSSYKGSCQCNPRLCISAEVCPVLYDRRGYTGRRLFSNTSCIWTVGPCFIRDSVCLADAGIELQCTPAV